MGSMRTWFRQFWCLSVKTTKNSTVYGMLFLLLLPALMFGSASLVVEKTSSKGPVVKPSIILDTEGMGLTGHLSNLFEEKWNRIRKVVFAPKNDFTEATIKNLAKLVELYIHEDVQIKTFGYDSIETGIKENLNDASTLYVLFDTSNDKIIRVSYGRVNGIFNGKVSSDKTFESMVQQALSMSNGYYSNEDTDYLSSAIILAENPNLKFVPVLATSKPSYRSWRPTDEELRESNKNLIFGAFLSLSLVLYLSVPIMRLAEEKRSKMVVQLKQLNVFDGAYWLSHWFPLSLFSMVGSLATLAIAHFTKFKTYELIGADRFFMIIWFCHLLVITIGMAIGGVVSRTVIVSSIIGFYGLIWMIFGTIGPIVEATFFNDNVFQRFILSVLFPVFCIIKSSRTPVTNDYSSIDESIKFIVGGIAIFYVIGWYLSQVFGNNDECSRKPMTFIFSINYWTGKSSAPETVIKGDVIGEMKHQSFEDQSIVLHKLTKSYGTGNTALKEFSLKMESNQCHAILGVNGAGKSTLLNLMTGGSSPTHGDGFIMGKSIRHEMSDIFSMISYCHQDDILWDNLSAADHVRTFARLRNVSIKKMDDYVFSVLSPVGLYKVKNQKVSTLSGGMKRRLSLALASIGDNIKIVFFDEPTTGMDPINRRKAWNVIQSMKKDRIVILTTHSMEEADELGDHVNILHSGRLRASGSPLYLKKQFDVGYQLKLSSKNDSLLESIKTKIVEKLFFFKLLSCSSGTLTFTVLPKFFNKLPWFLSALDKLNVNDEHVCDWTISNTTLEQVFLKVSEKQNDIIDESSNSQKVEENFCKVCQSRKAENVVLYSRSGVEVALNGLICFNCAGEQQQSLSTSHAEHSPSTCMDEELVFDFDTVAHEKITANFSEKGIEQTYSSTSLGRIKGLFWKNFVYEKKQRKNNICLLIFSVLISAGIIILVSTVPMMRYVPDRFACPNDNIKHLTEDQQLYESMPPNFDHIDSQFAQLRNPKNYHECSSSEVASIVAKDLKKGLGSQTESYSGGYKFTFGPGIPASLEEKLEKSLNPRRHPPSPYDGMVLIATFEEDSLRYGSDRFMSDSFTTRIVTEHLKHFKGKSLSIHSYRRSAIVVLTATSFTLGLTLIASMFIFICFLMMPRFADIIAYERLEKIFHLVRLSGLSNTEYWMGMFLFHTATLALFLGMIVIINGAIRWFSNGTFVGLVFVSLLMSGLCSISTGYMIGSLVKKRMAGTLISYIISLGWFISGLLTNIEHLVKDPSSLIWFPPTASVMLVQNALKCSTLYPVTYRIIGAPFVSLLIYCLISSIVALIFMSLSVSTLSFNLFSKLKKQNAVSDEEKNLAAALDVDVREEAQKVLKGEMNKDNSALCVKNLSKSFGSKSVLENVSFSMKYGECFGLLGPNGAGKTTLLNMLIGNESISGGEAFISGLPVGTKLFRSNRLGVCPQFDALWGELTVREHLKLYSTMRLGNVPSKVIDIHVQQIAMSIGLDGDALDFKTSGLSGGMKRRLSIGISMIGNPLVIFLDEPSTGVDPESRQQVWRAVEYIRSTGRQSLVITTHSMEEADSLCNRIGILANGNFQCIGTQTRLKSRFSDGYRLLINLLLKTKVEETEFSMIRNETLASEENQIFTAIRDYLKNDLACETEIIAKDAVALRSHGSVVDGIASWRIHQEIKLNCSDMSLLVGEIENLSKFGVSEWGLNQASLESVFIKMVKDFVSDD